MMKDIDADYYGYMDDDDGILVPIELRVEKDCKFPFYLLWLVPCGIWNLELPSKMYFNRIPYM